MNRNNDICPICQSEIDNTQKVVCPTCGTPHHRTCYMQNGNCANFELHNEGFVYEREPGVTYETENKALICKGCNNQLPDTALFCPNCATPVFEKQPNQQYGNNQQGNPQYGYNPFTQPPMFKDPNRMIDGVSAMDIAMYTKNNSQYFINSFERKTVSLNFAAAILGPIYLLYRKSYLYALILAVAQVIIAVPAILNNILYFNPEIEITQIPAIYQTILEISNNSVISTVLWMLSLAMTVIPLVLTNKLYKKKAYADINSINSQYGSDENARRFALSKKGGVNIAAVVSYLIIFGLLYGLFIQSFALTGSFGGVVA